MYGTKKVKRFRPKSLPVLAAVFLCGLVPCLQARSLPADVEKSLLQIDPLTHVEVLSSYSSRYSGYEGCYEAERYVEGRYRSLGLANVARQPFQVVVPVDRGARLRVGAQDIQLHCVRPNLARTPKTGELGLDGDLVWVGEGYLSDLNGKEIKGSIAIMEFNTGTRWLNAAKYGAAAVIFLEPRQAFRSEAEQKYLKVPLPLPRYYLQRSQLPALAAAVKDERSPRDYSEEEALAVVRGFGTELQVGANVKADMTWEGKTVYRISGEIPGADPDLAEQTIVIFAYYDSTSVVPALSPGAESACGIATQLEMVEFLLKHPPRRTVKFVAAPGHYQALKGARQYAQETVYPKRLESDEELRLAGEPYFFIALDLSSRNNSVAAFYKGHFYDQHGLEEVRLQRIYRRYSGLLVDWSDDVVGKERIIPDARYESGIVPQRGREWRSLIPDPVAFDAEVISMGSRPAITMATIADPRVAVATPLDTFERLRPHGRNLRQQAILCAYLIKRTVDVPEIPFTDTMPENELSSIFGVAVEQSLIAFMPRQPLSSAVVAADINFYQQKHKSMLGVEGTAYARSDQRGLFEIFGATSRTDPFYKMDGFDISPLDGKVEMIAESVLTPSSERERATDWAKRETDLRLSFFPCAATAVFDLVDPLHLRMMTLSKPIRASSNSELRYAVNFLGLPREGTSYSEPVAVFFTQKDERLKFLLTGALTGNDALLLNMGDREGRGAEDRGGTAGEAGMAQGKLFTGHGYQARREENFIYRTAYYMAADMHALDGIRLQKLRSAGIFKKNVWKAYDEAGKHLQAAQAALERKQFDLSDREAKESLANEGRVYPEVRGTSTDIVRGVIFYFALLIPFVIFAERMFINFVDIRKKLAAIAVLFALSYGVLRLVHPAFMLSNTPIIILIGFFMAGIASLVIALLLQKFHLLLERLRQRIKLIHRADVARASAAAAAFVLGISNMRKRKVRTALTGITIVLLTFTILSFTSFETVPARLLRYRSTEEAPYEGVLARNLAWDPMTEFIAYDIGNFFRTEDMQVSERSWLVSPEKGVELQIDVKRPGTDYEGVASGLMGLSPNENQLVLKGIESESALRGEWFAQEMEDWPYVCLLPTRMTESLSVGVDEIGKATVSLLGVELTVVGVLDSDRYQGYEDLDGEPLTPVSFQAEMKQRVQEKQEEAPAFTATGEISVEQFVARQVAGKAEKKSYVHMSPDQVLFVPHELCVRLGGTIRSVAVAAPGASALLFSPFKQMVLRFAGRVDMPLYAGLDGFTNRLATRRQLSIGGLKGLLVPILIASLIVFNTMLGAVYERVSEIKIYASVGLAPMHIASLFFAESCVFAVMGAMLGYLLGQVVSFGLMKLPWLLEGMSLNYSSMSAVWSALLVVSVVLASTAWPAHMAGKLSVPDVTRKMKIPKPTSDRWEILFPFTVSSRESLGVMSFLRDYFASNDEDAVGSFTAANARFRSQETEKGLTELLFDADVWIAPLDMGVSQHVTIACVPDEEEPEITYLRFTIERRSGEFQVWHRMNMGFLRDMRKQLLIWRLVAPEEKERLAEEGRAILSGAVPAYA